MRRRVSEIRRAGRDGPARATAVGTAVAVAMATALAICGVGGTGLAAGTTASPGPVASPAASPVRSPAASPGPVASPAASPVRSPEASPGARPGARVVSLTMTMRLQILDEAGRPLSVLPVRPGETLEISVANVAPFAHNLYIGPRDALAAGQTAGLPGVPAFAGGSQTLTWTVPDQVEGLWFGCTVVGHFSLMHGVVIAVADQMPDLVGMAEADALDALQSAGLVHGERREVADPTVSAGTVVAQEPPPGAPVDLDTVVRYSISGEPSASAA